jgi:hypothetical protein
MQAWEESLGTGGGRLNGRDFDDFDELNDDELSPDEESEFAIRYMDAVGEGDEEVAEQDGEADLLELEEERRGSLQWTPSEEW